MEVLECEGACEEHQGEVKSYIVSRINFGTMEFNYCDEAVRIDRDNGFTVELKTTEGE